MDTVQLLNYKVSRVTGIKEVEGRLFGIELELEGRNVGLADVATPGWKRKAEPSLRGESIEFMTAGPKTFDQATKIVNGLFKKFEDYGAQLNKSLRTSTHVHVNFSDQPIKKVVNFFVAFSILEEMLEFYSGGEDRKGSHFAIACRDADGIIPILRDSLAKGNLQQFAGGRYKYGACNLSSLYEFGTLEIRTMKGANSAEEVNGWLNVLNDLYEFACERMVSPVDLIVKLSQYGPDEFLRLIFKPENVRALMRRWPAARDLYGSLMEGVRTVQVLAYEFEEAFNAPVPEEKVVEVPAGALPKKLPGGRHYAIYRPDGELWYCHNEFGPNKDFWTDGECLDDCHEIFWSAAQNRFVYETDNGLIPCAWWKHHEIKDEGGPLIFHNMGAEDMEDIPDFDEGDEI